jgi:hypothetical protein
VELACPHGTHSPKIDDAATRAITLLRNLELEDQFPQADMNEAAAAADTSACG